MKDTSGPANEPTPEQVKDKVRAVLALMREEWQCATYDKIYYWYAFEGPPVAGEMEWKAYNPEGRHTLGEFDLPDYPGDWRESLVER